MNNLEVIDGHVLQYFMRQDPCEIRDKRVTGDVHFEEGIVLSALSLVNVVFEGVVDGVLQVGKLEIVNATGIFFWGNEGERNSYDGHVLKKLAAST